MERHRSATARASLVQLQQLPSTPCTCTRLDRRRPDRPARTSSRWCCVCTLDPPSCAPAWCSAHGSSIATESLTPVLLTRPYRAACILERLRNSSSPPITPTQPVTLGPTPLPKSKHLFPSPSPTAAASARCCSLTHKAAQLLA